VQNYGPANATSITDETQHEDAVRKAEYSLHVQKHGKKPKRRGGLKHSGTQHLRPKSHAWHL
jgi:hypothetical protein